MQFNFKFGFRKTATSKIQLISAIGFFWQKIYKLVFLVFLVSMIALGGYIWRKSLSGGEWSAEKKQEYLDAQNKGVVFKENDFKKALSDVELRKRNDSDEKKPVKNVFKPY